MKNCKTKEELDECEIKYIEKYNATEDKNFYNIAKGGDGGNTLLGYSETSAKRLITLFVYTYTNGIEDYSSEEEYNDIYRNAFANYFECNIKHLSISDNLLTDFSIKIKEDLEKLSNHIDTVITEKEAELFNKKKNKKG